MPVDTTVNQSLMTHINMDGNKHIYNLPEAELDTSPVTLEQANNFLLTKQNVLTAGTNITIDVSNPMAPVISATATTPTEVDGGTWT